MSFMRNFLKFTKGAIPESLIRSVLNKKLAGIAEVQEFEIDSQGNTARLKLTLSGEHTPLTIYIDDYEFHRNGEQASVKLGWLRADREWLQNVLERFVVGKSFEIPADKVELADAFLG